MGFRTQHILTLDTETATLVGGVYDVAFAVHTRKGKVLESYSAVIREVATNPKAMMSAYYARKMFSHYLPMVADQKIPLVKWLDFVQTLREAVTRYDVKTVAAYNLAFDRRALRNTHHQLGNKGAILPYPIRQLDIWEFACRARLVLRKYKRLALAQGWVSDVGNIRTTAECAYRFVSGDLTFKESHTALEDVQIETEILADCFRAKGPVPYDIITGSPWKLVNQK